MQPHGAVAAGVPVAPPPAVPRGAHRQHGGDAVGNVVEPVGDDELDRRARSTVRVDRAREGPLVAAAGHRDRPVELVENRIDDAAGVVADDGDDAARREVDDDRVAGRRAIGVGAPAVLTGDPTDESSVGDADHDPASGQVGWRHLTRPEHAHPARSDVETVAGHDLAPLPDRAAVDPDRGATGQLADGDLGPDVDEGVMGLDGRIAESRRAGGATEQVTSRGQLEDASGVGTGLDGESGDRFTPDVVHVRLCATTDSTRKQSGRRAAGRPIAPAAARGSFLTRSGELV